MRSTSVLSLAILAGSVLAVPHHQHQHQKREVKSVDCKTVGNTVVEYYEKAVHVTVTVTEGETYPTSTSYVYVQPKPEVTSAPVYEAPVYEAPVYNPPANVQPEPEKERPAQKAPEAPTIPSDRDSPAAFVAAHNKYRRQHVDCPDVQWDEELARSAQAALHADKNNYANCPMEHSGTDGVGENLAIGNTDGVGSVDMWAAEIKDYKKGDGFSGATGHYTQVVWKSTTKIGCAVREDSACMGGKFIVCQYSPPGNYMGQFDNQVPTPY